MLANRATMLANIWINMLANMLAPIAIQYISKQRNQHSWIFIHSLIDFLSRMSECEAAAYLIMAFMIDDHDKKTRDSTRKWLRRREQEGMYVSLVQELLVEDTRTYREMRRMSYKSFKKILGFIEPHITPKDSVFRYLTENYRKELHASCWTMIMTALMKICYENLVTKYEFKETENTVHRNL